MFGRTDVGRTRDHNEDAFIVADLTADVATVPTEVRRTIAGPKGSVFMVADGMGGAAAGEIASAMAVEAILGELRTTWIGGTTNEPEAFVRAIKQATKAANEKIHSYAPAHPEYRGMGRRRRSPGCSATRSTSRRSATAAPTSCATASRTDHEGSVADAEADRGR